MSETQREMNKARTFVNGSAEWGSGINAVAIVFNYVLKYFHTLGFNISVYCQISSFKEVQMSACLKKNIINQNGVVAKGSSELASVSSLINDVVEFRSSIRQHAVTLSSKEHQVISMLVKSI